MKSKKALTRRKILHLLHQRQNILKKYKVRKIGLFGSYARDNQRRGSDIDFLVEFEEPSFENFIRLVHYLQKTFGRNVDVLTPDGVQSIRVREIAENIKKSVVYV